MVGLLNLQKFHSEHGKTLSQSSKGQVAEFLMIRGSIEESERLLIEGYLSHKWGIVLPSEHPWAFEPPTFGEIVSEDSTPVGITSQTLEPIIVNRTPANQTDSSASLTGQLISAGLGLVKMLRSILQNIPVFDFGWMLDADADGTDGSFSTATDQPF